MSDIELMVFWNGLLVLFIFVCAFWLFTGAFLFWMGYRNGIKAKKRIKLAHDGVLGDRKVIDKSLVKRLRNSLWKNVYSKNREYKDYKDTGKNENENDNGKEDEDINYFLR